MSLWTRLRDALRAPEAPKGPPQLRAYFAGAAENRLTGDFLGGLTSGREELKADLVTLRTRSRQLCRDNPNARRFLALCAENVIGHKGIRLQAKAENARGELSTDLNGKIESAWDLWGRAKYCTVTGQASWPYFQAQLLKTVARDGEAFVRLVRGYPNRFGFALQLLDADLLEVDYEVKAKPGQNAIRSSIEVDAYDRPVAYHVLTRHPSDTSAALAGPKARTRIPAGEMLHLFLPNRMGQVRGEPWLTPVIIWLQMLYGYAEAELVAARTAAAKMGFITQGEDAMGADPDAVPQTMEAAAGVIDRLAKGESFVPWDPTHPAGNFGPFLTTVLHQVATGLNVSHASLTGDLSQVNYSSIRAGMLAERDQWRLLQAWFSEHACQPVYEAWLPMAMLSPVLTLPGGDPARYVDAATWQPRGWAWVDPEKDVNAVALARQNGLTTLRRTLAEQGEDLEEMLAERAEEDALLKQYGITLGDTPPPATAEGDAATEATPGDTTEDAAEARRLRLMRAQR